MRTSVVFCDDVRQEVTGKHILIGVYGGDLNMNLGPGSLPLAVWIQLSDLAPGKHTFVLTFQRHAEETDMMVATADGDINLDEARNSAAIAFSPLLIEVNTDCSISVSISVDGAPKIEIGKLNIHAAFAAKQL